MSEHKNQFENKIILVTGSTQGVGAETAKLFAAADHQVTPFYYLESKIL